jgi:hypothetical protein
LAEIPITVVNPDSAQAKKVDGLLTIFNFLTPAPPARGGEDLKTKRRWKSFWQNLSPGLKRGDFA